MRKIASVLIETLVILGVGIGLGLGANALRGRNSIRLDRNYFPKLPLPDLSSPEPRQNANRPLPSTTESARATEPPATAQTPESPFQELNFDEVVAIFKDPNKQAGLYVFVDARNDDAFQAGHIPGAVQCDFYRLEYYLPNVLPVVSGTAKVVVYCNGRECEDSLSVCEALRNAGIPAENILHYRNGWEEWQSKGMPVAKGRE
jgi:rhodanese-related sulfurtransferase